MPFRKDLYPSDWKQIRQRILDREGHKCWECGVQNYARGARDIHGVWHHEDEIDMLPSSVGESLFKDGEYPKIIRIILTIAHLDNPDPSDCREENLAALCNLCHLRHDLDHHVRSAALTRRKRKMEAGQLLLLDDQNESEGFQSSV